MNTSAVPHLFGKTLLTRAELAHLLATTPRHIKTLGDQRKIPVIDLGHRTKRYALEDVLEALQKFERKAVN